MFSSITQQHTFADDNQLYKFFELKSTESQQEAVDCIEQTVSDALEWMAANKLKCNAEKTEVIVFTPKNKTVNVTIKIDNVEMKTSDCVRNLGVLDDRHMTLEQHVTKLCRAANYQLKRIGSIRRYLTCDATKSLVNSLVVSRIDYCNSLIYALRQHS